tara:strand:- start:558 stop:878 length:321 start_codon:yes stop_codon:yes gene_type:complete
MTLENFEKDNTFNKNFSFLKNWHEENYTLLPKGSKNKDTSMQLGTFEFDGITYILPTYKKGKGKIGSNEFLDEIKTGKILGYNSDSAAQKDLEKIRAKILGKQNGN